jgi:multidrug resistance protein, MATE family
MQIPASRRLWTSEARALIALALPLILGNLAQALINATDLVYMGRIGPDAVAAASLAFNLFLPFLLFGLGILAAVSPMIAAARGRKVRSVRDIRRTVRQGFWVAAAVCVPMSIILWNAEIIFLAMGQDPGLSRDAGRFVQVLQWGLLPVLLHLVLRFFVSALERPTWGTIVLFGGVFANALFGWLLVFGHWGFPRFGFIGAAMASVLSEIVLFVGMAVVVLRVRLFRRYAVFGRWWRADWARFRQLFALGLPIAITLTFEVTVFSGAIFLMGLIDRASIAAHAVAIQIATFSFMVPMGIAQAATVRVGLGFGARDAAAVHRAGWIALAIGVGFMACTALVILAVPDTLIGLFIDAENAANAEVVALAGGFLWVAALFQIVDGAQVVGAGVLRGLQDTRWPMIYAAVGYWVIGIGVGTLLAFPLAMRGLGIWIGLAAGLAFVAALIVTRWIRRETLGLVSVER